MYLHITPWRSVYGPPVRPKNILAMLRIHMGILATDLHVFSLIQTLKSHEISHNRIYHHFFCINFQTLTNSLIESIGCLREEAESDARPSGATMIKERSATKQHGRHELEALNKPSSSRICQRQDCQRQENLKFKIYTKIYTKIVQFKDSS